MSYDATNGLLVGNKSSGSWSGFRTQITSSAFNILSSAGETLASYGAKLVELGKNATDAVISLCGGVGKIHCSPTYDDGNNLTIESNRLLRFLTQNRIYHSARANDGEKYGYADIDLIGDGMLLDYNACIRLQASSGVYGDDNVNVSALSLEGSCCSILAQGNSNGVEVWINNTPGAVDILGKLNVSGHIEGVTNTLTLSIANTSGTGYTSTIDTNNSKVFTKTGQVFINARSKLVLSSTIAAGTTINLGKISDYLPPSVCAISLWQNSTQSRRFMGSIDSGNICLKSSADMTAATYYIYFQTAYVC
jgi:hypothetical protein